LPAGKNSFDHLDDAGEVIEMTRQDPIAVLGDAAAWPPPRRGQRGPRLQSLGVLAIGIRASPYQYDALR
jgi:hypothetical protein